MSDWLMEKTVVSPARHGLRIRRGGSIRVGTTMEIIDIRRELLNHEATLKTEFSGARSDNSKVKKSDVARNR